MQNIIRRAIIFSSDKTIRRADLMAGLRLVNREPFRSAGIDAPDLSEPPELYKTAKEKVVNRFTMDYVGRLLEHTDGNVTKAAELSGLGRASLQKIMRRLSLTSDQYKKK